MAKERSVPHAHAMGDARDARCRATFQQTPFGIAHTAPDGRVLEVNPALAAMLGHTSDELAQVRLPHDLLADDENRSGALRAYQESVEKLLRGDITAFSATEHYRHSNGTSVWVHRTVSHVRDSGATLYLAHFMEDITARREADEQRRAADLRYQCALESARNEAEAQVLRFTHYDQLTGLANRALFCERVTHGLAQAARNHWTLATMFVDVDRFKSVNDTAGHMVGDAVLRAVASRLTECVRAEDTVSRLSGDEFAIVLAHLSRAQDAGLVAAKILRRVREPYRLEGHEIVLTASAGISVYPQDAEDPEALMRNAHVAMHNAKPHGDSYQFYTAEMNVRVLAKLQLEARLRGALERNEFVLHYQPKIDIDSGRICGFEALLRWQPPGEPLVAPGEFIPLLEETGMIGRVGEWVLKAACAQLAAWRDAGCAPVPMAINLSARQLRDGLFGEAMARALYEFRVEPRLIELEMTESSLMENPDEAHRMLDELKALGVSLAIDDFGTGYSSLGYLKRFPFDTLKIDRSFVRDIGVDPDDAMIARTIIALAGSLGLTVVAEGVESEEQLAFLAANRCEQAQGFLFSRPVPAREASELLMNTAPLFPPVRRGGRLQTPAVLVLGSQRDRLIQLQQLLQRDGYHVLTASRIEDALEVLARHCVLAAIADEAPGEATASDFLRQVKSVDPQVLRVMVGYGEAELDAAENPAQMFFVKHRDDPLLREEVRKIMRRNYRPPARMRGATRKAQWRASPRGRNKS